MKPVKSSNIEAVGFKDGVLSVRFKGGNVYDYPGVTAEQHHKFVNAESVGSHFHNHIKGRFDGKKRDK
jgi:hypothetical protein